jgi:hypothetical protein
MPLTGNVIDIQKIQLTDTFQTWFAKTNEMVDALNPVNIYDIDNGYGTYVSYGITGVNYNGIKYVNVNAAYGVGVATDTGRPWSGVVALDLSSISGDAYTLTGNQAYTLTGGAILASEVNAYDWFVVQDLSDTTQGASGTTKKVQARNMLPREIYMPTLDFWGDFNVRGNFSAVGAASTQVGSLSINSQYVFLATTGSAGSTAGAYISDSALGEGGVILAITGSGNVNKRFLWKHNGGNSYWTFSTPFGANEPNLPLVASKFISRNFVTGTTANTFIFEAAGSTSTRLWLTENGLNPYFGIVKDTNSSNVNLNVYNGAGITSVAYIIAGATSQYTGVTANAFIRFANVDMVDGANATTGASAWTIPVTDQFGQIYEDRHNAGQIKRRFTQTSHGLTTGQAVTVVVVDAASGTPGTITGAQANSTSKEAFGIVDRIINANEFSVTMKGYIELSPNGLRGIGTAVTGQTYYLDWARHGCLTANTNVPSGNLYQPLFMALGGSAGIVYGNEADVIFPFAQDQVYMRGMVPIGAIQPYAGGLAGLSLGLSGGSIPVSDVQYNDNWMPCDGRALTANTFVDLFNLIGYTYSMRGTIVSQTGTTPTVIRPDRGTANIASLGLAAGTIRYIRRGSNSPGVIANLAYSGGITADGTTITVAGIVTNNTNLGSNGDIVDILSPSVDSYFFAPDLRGKAPFGEYALYGSRGEAFGLSGGFTGGTANGDGGLFTNFIIRAKRDSDAMILTGHNHDSRYLRKDVSDSVSLASSTLTLQNLNVVGNIAGIASAYTGLATFNAGITSNHLYVSNGATFAGTSVYNGLATFNTGITSSHLYVSRGVTFASTSVHNGLATFNTGITSSHLFVTNGVTFASTSPSSSTTTGALVVAGGVGIGGSLYIGGGITATASIVPSAWANGAAPKSYISTSAPILANFPISGSIWFVV